MEIASTSESEALSVAYCFSPSMRSYSTPQDNQNYCIIADAAYSPSTEMCRNNVSDGLKDFFYAVQSSEGLLCLSACSSESNRSLNCYDGSCQLQNVTGPRCLCPRTDLYIYTSSNCQGRLLKAGIYGGVGASIAILLIAIFVAAFFIFRWGKVEKWDVFAMNQEENWYEDKDDEWHTDRGIINISQIPEEDLYNRGKFTPTLENIDTKLEIKIQRPKISYA
ncbi:mucin-3A-like [Pseudophryne corroboree]|uniref:mucin-3A-like n=1 Tax=Pseudophryne corroboree TaxID=495146 RepID=UPI003081D693